MRQNISDGPISRRRAIALATYAVVGAGVLWRVARYLANWPLWGDEAYIAVSLLTRDFLGLTKPLEYYQIAPPGFLWAELVSIRSFGASELALRLLPFACGIASLFLFCRLASTVLDRRSALMAIAFFAVSFYPVRHANEVKPYSSDLLLALVIIDLAVLAWNRPDSKRMWGLMTLVSAVGVWVSYPLILVSTGVGVVLGVRAWLRRSRSFAPVVAVLIFLAATLASWAAMYGLVARPQALAAPFLTQMDTWEDSFPPILRPWALPWWLLKTHTGNMLAYPYGGNHFGSVLTTLLVIAGSIGFWKRNRAVLILLLAPLGPAFLAAALHRYPYGTSARISLFMAPAICLLAGRGLYAVLLHLTPHRLARSALFATTAAFGLIAVAGAAFSVAVPYKDIDDLELKQIVGRFAAETRPSDRWIGFNGLLVLPKVKQLMLMPWLQHAAQFHFYVLRDAPMPVDWNPAANTDLARSPGRTWFLLHTFGYDHFPFELLQTHLARLVNRDGPPVREKINVRKDEDVEAFVFENR
jgi:hypothetical protein